MGGIGDQHPSSAPPGPAPRPTIALPPRTSMDSLFNGGPSGGAFGFSPGPMTLVSSFFNENDDFKSFSQLLAGAMSSPVAPEQKDSGQVGSSGGGGGGFNQNRPSGLAVMQSPMFTVPPGLSPAGLLDSPGLFSASQGPFGISHQQALAQVTAQTLQANPKMHIQNENPSSVSAAPASTSNTRQHQMPPHSMPDSGTTMKECPDDGFNWRKYGQKQVKGSEFPRSYYKCTHPNCPVKKKVERSLDDDHVVAIIYKGQHNHQPPRPNKRAKDPVATTSNENSFMQGNFDVKEGKTCGSAAEHVSEGSSDSEQAAGDRETEVEEKNDEPDPKRRNTEARVSEAASSHRTAIEPRIIVQTTSEVDLLDDGYRWRKYGQKVVKGNPYPRSYYKCTTAGCNVRKHVERASTDPKAVITTYEGKHNHDVPAAKSNSHTIANNTASQLKAHNTTISEKHSFNIRGVGANEQQPVARLRLKEEQIT